MKNERRKRIAKKMQIDRNKKRDESKNLKKRKQQTTEKQTIEKKHENVSKSNQASKTLIEDFFANFKKKFAKLSSEQRKEIRLESKLKKNVIEANSRFAIMKKRTQKKRNMKKMKRNKKHENTNSKQVFKKTSKRKSVDLNMNFIDEAIFQKKLRKMNENFFRSSYRSSLMSINFYDEILNERFVETLNSLNFFKSDFKLNSLQSSSNQNQNTHEISLSIQRQSSFRSKIRSKLFFISFCFFFKSFIFYIFWNSFWNFFFNIIVLKIIFASSSFSTRFFFRISTAVDFASVFFHKIAFFHNIVSFTSSVSERSEMSRRRFITIDVSNEKSSKIENLYRDDLVDVLKIIDKEKSKISTDILRKINKMIKKSKKTKR